MSRIFHSQLEMELGQQLTRVKPVGVTEDINYANSHKRIRSRAAAPDTVKLARYPISHLRRFPTRSRRSM